MSARCVGVRVYSGSLSPRRGTRTLEGAQDRPRRDQACRGAAHARAEEAYVRAGAASKMPAYWIGMNAITGPSEAWFFSGYDSYDALEKENDAFNAAVGKQMDAADEGDAQFRTGTRVYLLELNEDLSYQMRPTVQDMRYITVFHDSRQAWVLTGVPRHTQSAHGGACEGQGGGALGVLRGHIGRAGRHLHDPVRVLGHEGRRHRSAYAGLPRRHR